MRDRFRRPAVSAARAVAAVAASLTAALFLAPPLAGQETTAAGQITALLLEDRELTIRASAPFALVGVQVDPDASIVIQLPGFRPASSLVDLFPEAGLLAAVRAVAQESPRGPITRVILTPRRPLSHTFEPGGSLLTVRLRPRDEPAPPSAGEQAQRVAEAEEQLERERRAQEGLRARAAQLEREKAALGERLAELERRRAETSEALENTLGEIQQLAQIRVREQELETELAAARSRAEQLATELSQQEAQTQAWMAEVDRAGETQSDTAAELERLTAERDRLATELADARLRAETLLTAGFERGRVVSRANVRREPSTESEILDVVEPRTPVEVLEAGAEWYRVRHGAAEGWIWGELMSVESEEVARLEAEVEAAREARRTLEERLADTDDLGRRLAETEAERDRLADERDEARTRLAAAADSAQRLPEVVAERDRLADELDEARTRLAATEDAGQRVTEIEAERDRLADELEARRLELGGLAAERDELQTRLAGADEASRRLTEVEAERGRLAEELESARADLERLQTEGVARAVTLSAVNLRAGPSTDDEALELLPEGATLAVTDRIGEWISVRAGPTPGWVFADLVRLESDRVAELEERLATAESARDTAEEKASEATTQAEAERQRASGLAAANRDLESRLAASREETDRLRREGLELAQVVDAANLREGPGTDQPRVTLLAPATTVEILETTDEWVRVRAGSAEGWVWGELLTPASERIRELESDLEAARAELVALNSDLDQAAAQRTRAIELAVERDRLASELSQARQEIATLASRVDEAQGARAQAERREAELTAANERYEADLARARGESDAYRRTANSVEDGARNLDEQLASARRQLAQAKARNLALEERLAELESPAEPEAVAPPTASEAQPDASLPPEPASPAAQEDVAGTAARTTVRTFLRTGPGTDYGSIALISPATPVRILGSDGEWYQVRVRATEGWMYGPLLELAGP